MEDAHVLQLKNRKFSDLYLCFCGYARCLPLHSFGPAVRPNYILHYIIKGKGRFTVGNEEYRLRGGQGFLIEPEVLTFYEADKEDPWTYVWIGFSGERAGEYLRDLGLGSGHPIYQCSSGEKLEKIVQTMLENKNYTVANEYLLEGLLYQFFSVLAENIEIGEGRRDIWINWNKSQTASYVSSPNSILSPARLLLRSLVTVKPSLIVTRRFASLPYAQVSLSFPMIRGIW